MKILYSEPVDLKTVSLNILDHLFYLAEKYLILEVQQNILEAVNAVKDYLRNVKDITILLNIESESPVKNALTEVVIEFLMNIHSGAYSYDYVAIVEQVSFLASAYYSGLYSDRVKKAMVMGIGDHIFNVDSESEALRILAVIPQSEANSKFIHMLIRKYYGLTVN